MQFTNLSLKTAISKISSFSPENAEIFAFLHHRRTVELYIL
jgi:hypothetical protein